MSEPNCSPTEPITPDTDTTLAHQPEQEVVSVESPVAKAALGYAAQHGLAVFPCKAGDKRPATANGFKDATKVSEEIRLHFRQHRNVAIRTGEDSAVFVLDVDMPGGDATLAALVAEHSELPRTVTASTPSGGKHYYFRFPEGGSIGISAGKIGQKLDIRGEGGYVVAPPSSTAAGAYRWDNGCSPDVTGFADAPTWLIDLVRSGGPATTKPAVGLGDGKVPEGGRNAALASLAGVMRRSRCNEAAIVAALRVENRSKCSPPLPDGEIRQIAKSVAKYAPGGDAPMLPFKPFPIEALPEPFGTFVADSAKSIGCDPSYIALPLLTALASAIGNSRTIELKAGWTEPSILWSAIVGDSGTMKSPALEIALRAVRQRQTRNLAGHEFAVDAYSADSMRYDLELAAWKKNGCTGLLPQKPQEPIADRTWADDLTIEALAMLLLNQPRGLLVACDELATWLGGFNKYSSSGGGDAERWIEMYGGRSMVVDRKTGEPKTIIVPKASVSVTGGIQPGPLRRALTLQHRESGFAARILLTNPPPRPKRWTEAGIDPAVVERIAEVFERLYGLEADGSVLGALKPQVVRLSAAAKSAWVEFYNEHALDIDVASGDLKAAFSKLEGYAARFALVLHLTEQAAGGEAKADEVSAECFRSSRLLIDWFKYETRRVYAMLSESEADRELQELEGKVAAKGGAITVRELMRSSSTWGTAHAAEQALGQLKDAGRGHWQVTPPTSNGGQPTRRLVLGFPPATDRTSSNSES